MLLDYRRLPIRWNLKVSGDDDGEDHRTVLASPGFRVCRCSTPLFFSFFFFLRGFISLEGVSFVLFYDEMNLFYLRSVYRIDGCTPRSTVMLSLESRDL